jgi:hypothetical protein
MPAGGAPALQSRFAPLLAEIGTILARVGLLPARAGLPAARIATLPARGGMFPTYAAVIEFSERGRFIARWKRPNARWKRPGARWKRAEARGRPFTCALTAIQHARETFQNLLHRGAASAPASILTPFDCRPLISDLWPALSPGSGKASDGPVKAAKPGGPTVSSYDCLESRRSAGASLALGDGEPRKSNN